MDDLDRERQRREKLGERLAMAEAVLDAALRDDPGWRDKARAILYRDLEPPLGRTPMPARGRRIPGTAG